MLPEPKPGPGIPPMPPGIPLMPLIPLIPLIPPGGRPPMPLIPPGMPVMLPGGRPGIPVMPPGGRPPIPPGGRPGCALPGESRNPSAISVKMATRANRTRKGDVLGMSVTVWEKDAVKKF